MTTSSDLAIVRAVSKTIGHNIDNMEKIKATAKPNKRFDLRLVMAGTFSLLLTQVLLLHYSESRYYIGDGDEHYYLGLNELANISTHNSTSRTSMPAHEHVLSSTDYEVVTTNYGWTTPASKTFLRRILSGEFFRAILSHPKYNATAWQDLENHPDPSRKLAVFLDVDTCMDLNYPIYGSAEVNVEKDHPLKRNAKWHDLPGACEYIQRAAQSPALRANPDSKLVLDCSGSRRHHYLHNICRWIFEKPNYQVVLAYTSIRRNQGGYRSIGLPPPAIKPINLTIYKRNSIQTCKERKYIFSFQGNADRGGRDNLKSLIGEDDVYIRLVSREMYAKDFTAKGSDTMNYGGVMKESVFAAAPRGDCLFSYRFAEILSAGAIPVVYADGWLPPFNTFNETAKQAFDWSACAVFIPESEYGKTLDILRAIPMAKRCEMQQCAIQAWDRYLSSRRGWLRGILESLPYVNAEVEAEKRRWRN